MGTNPCRLSQGAPIMFVPTYLMTVMFMNGEELQKEIITLPFVPNPGHIIKLHGWRYKVLTVTADVDSRGISIDMEEI